MIRQAVNQQLDPIYLVYSNRYAEESAYLEEFEIYASYPAVNDATFAGGTSTGWKGHTGRPMQRC